MNQEIGLSGRFKIAVLRDGQTIAERVIPNTVMNAGKAEITGLMLTDIGGTAFDYIAVGTDSTAPNATQSALLVEKYRVAGTGSQQTTTTTNDTARLTTSISITASDTIQEAGIFNSSSAGDMLARTTFSAISVGSGDVLNIGYDIKLS